MKRKLIVLVALFLFVSKAVVPNAHAETDEVGYEFAGGTLGFVGSAALSYGACRLILHNIDKKDRFDSTAATVSVAGLQTLACLAVGLGGIGYGSHKAGSTLGGLAEEGQWDENRGFHFTGALHGSYSGPLLAYSIADLSGRESPGALEFGISSVSSAALAYGAGAFAQWANPKCGARGYGAGSVGGSLLNILIGIPIAAIADTDQLNSKVAIGMALSPFVFGAAGAIFCN